MLDVCIGSFCTKWCIKSGFSVMIFDNNKILYMYKESTTWDSNNERENLKGILHALKEIKQNYVNEVCVIFTDNDFSLEIYRQLRHNIIESPNSFEFQLIKQIKHFLTDNECIRLYGPDKSLKKALAQAYAKEDFDEFIKLRQIMTWNDKNFTNIEIHKELKTFIK